MSMVGDRAADGRPTRSAWGIRAPHRVRASSAERRVAMSVDWGFILLRVFESGWKEKENLDEWIIAGSNLREI
jgi:hypothetical protein